jgi:RNA polymerase sigma factor (sigma-70 family)
MNQCISLIRKRKVEDRRNTELRQLQSDVTDINKAVDEERVRAEALNTLWEEVYGVLDKQNADMLWLRYVAGWSDAEIAEEYQIHKSTLRGMRKRALEKLRKVLGKDRFYLLILLLAIGWL